MIVQLGILYSLWNGKSALMLAAEGGHTETVKTLLDAGANVSVKIVCCTYNGMLSLMSSFLYSYIYNTSREARFAHLPAAPTDFHDSSH